jgi:hypothetical protein
MGIGGRSAYNMKPTLDDLPMVQAGHSWPSAVAAALAVTAIAITPTEGVEVWGSMAS